MFGSTIQFIFRIQYNSTIQYSSTGKLVVAIPLGDGHVQLKNLVETANCID